MFLSQTRYACLPLAVPLAADPRPQPIAVQLRSPQRPDRALSSLSCRLTEWKTSSRETCLFVRGELERVKEKKETETREREKKRERERACEMKLRKFNLAGKQEGRGAEGVKGEGGRQHTSLDSPFML